MQTGVDARRDVALRPGVRVGLLGLAVGAAWLAVSLFTGGQEASAATGDSDDGLLGSLVSQVADTTTDAVQAVSAPVKQAVAPVQKAAQPVKQAVAPVAQVVKAVPEVVSAPASVTTVVKSVPVAVVQTVRNTADVVGSVPQTVSDVAEAVPAVLDAVEVKSITEPVTTLLDTVVNDTVGEVPVAGELVTDLLGDEPTGDLLAPVVGDFDGVVDVIAGVAPAGPEGPSPGGTGDDSAPALPSETPGASVVPGLGDRTHHVPTAVPSYGSADDAPAAVSGEQRPSDTPAGGSMPPAAPAAPSPTGGQGASAGGSGSAGATMISDAASAALLHEAKASLALGTVCDELPSSPMFDTDSTPD